MRRIAWKQCSSCSAASDTDVTRLARKLRRRRVDALAAGFEHRRHGMLGEPVDLEAGPEAAQLVGDRDVAAGVAEADRRGDVERAQRA